MGEFIVKENGSLQYLQSRTLSNSNGVKHFFSTKNGGVSPFEYESLNLGVYTNDSKENVEKNFNIICSSLNMNEKVAYLNQEHGDTVYIVNKENFSDVVGKKGDALITCEKNLPIGVFTADCVPILLYDKNKKVAAAIHAGWRGVEAKILTNTLGIMKKEFNSESSDIICAIGPSIGECCFEVSSDVGEKFKFSSEKNGKVYVDLLKEVYSECLSEGLLEENIDLANKCTVCEKELFYSYRRDNGLTGRIGSFIEII